MQKVQLDRSKLLGFKLKRDTGAKLGNKPAGAKLGNKPTATGAKLGAKPDVTGAKLGTKEL